jgi:type II restriction/modification system DNA methylase subunit YeeA
VSPREFVRKWRPSTLREDQASQSHFNDLCSLLEEPTPTEADPAGTWYCFEAGAKKTGGGTGWADVWKKGHFAWEYKGKHKGLDAAFAQLQRYRIALQNPPLLIVSDMDTISIHTNFTYTVEQVYDISLEDLLVEDTRRLLKRAFAEPEALKPGVTRKELTEQAAAEFAELAQSLHTRGYQPQRVAHFVNKVLFCLFAEDIGILPPRLFTRLLEAAAKKPGRFQEMAGKLFAAMKDGGDFDLEVIDWFNGGLFDDDDALPLDKQQIDLIRGVSQLDWSAIEPSIFGTLFERGLDPGKRGQLGTHYTDRGSIMHIVEPVVLAPLRHEWAGTKQQIEQLLAKSHKAKSKSSSTKFFLQAKEKCREFLNRLQGVRVLDPACGSGNFLYLALLGLKDLERRVIDEAEQLGLPPFLPAVGPQSVTGIEINPYAAELARVTIWIGQIQWMLNHGFGLSRSPILQKLDQISCRDALLNDDGTEARWPAAEFIVGNPPFLGDKKMISELGEDYVALLRGRYKGRVPGGADLVTYWFDKAWRETTEGRAIRAGLVATNSIRGGQNRKVLDTICERGRIFEAWSDEPWILEGAAVRVSIVCFEGRRDLTLPACLDGNEVSQIYADLTGRAEGASAADLTTAKRLAENLGVIFMGTTKVGAFHVGGATARKWLLLSGNPNGRPNGDVVRPWANAMDLTRRPSDTWIIDFGTEMPEAVAALYEAPFEHLVKNVKPERLKNRREVYRRLWWRHGEPRPALRGALAGLSRYIATPAVAKHRLFVFMDGSVVPDHQVFVIARDDDTTFGILHSRFHEAWALRLGTSLEDRPRYTPTSTFETFPFPEGLTPNIPAPTYANNPRATAIAQAAKRLNELRENWLSPPELVHRLPEVVPGFPERVIPADATAAQLLKTRTLTNLYNQCPTWLLQAHHEVDAAVAAAYGWPADIATEEVLLRLLQLNLERRAACASLAK